MTTLICGDGIKQWPQVPEGQAQLMTAPELQEATQSHQPVLRTFQTAQVPAEVQWLVWFHRWRTHPDIVEHQDSIEPTHMLHPHLWSKHGPGMRWSDRYCWRSRNYHQSDFH